MTAIIRAELFKLATTRAPWLAGAFMVAFASIGPLVFGLTDTRQSSGFLTNAAAQLDAMTLTPVTLVAAVIGALVATSDHRHGSIVGAVLATPRRHRLVIAKAAATTVVATALVAVAGVVLLVLSVGLVSFQGGVWSVPISDYLIQLGRGGFPVIALAVIGYGLGEVVRNQAMAVTIPLVVMTILTPIAMALSPDLAWYLPSGLDAILAHGATPAPIGRTTAGLLLAGYAAIAVGIGGMCLVRRDVV